MGDLMSQTRRHFNSHYCVKLPVPTKSFAGQTIIVTGSNIGMGLEAARHLVRLEAAKVILAVRSISKGQEAAKSIEATTGRPNIVEVWELDLASHSSVIAFAQRASALDRLDVLINNAGVYPFEFERSADTELAINVNVIGTSLLSLLLLPKLRETSVKFEKETVLTATGSFVHYLTKFPEQNSERILDDLSVEKDARMRDRYNVSKMIQLLFVRELASRVSESTQPGNVVVSICNPGFVATTIMRHGGALYQFWFRPLKAIMARTPEEGGRILVNAAEGGAETHGQYLDDCKVGIVSNYVESEQGHKIQLQLWNELSAKLDKISPGVMKNI